MNKDFIKESEKMVISRVKHLQKSMELLDELNWGFNSYIPERYRIEFSKYMTKARDVLYRSFSEGIINVMRLNGVGGKEAEKYSIEQMKELFSEEHRYNIMGLLAKDGVSTSYFSEDDKEFRKQMKKRLEDLKK
jgi:hypothetical protein